MGPPENASVSALPEPDGFGARAPAGVAGGTAGTGGTRDGTGPTSVEHFYSVIRGQIEHEDNLISSRLNWFLTSQSFLFTAYAISAGNVLQPVTGVAHERVASLLLLVPLVAVVTCLVIASGIVGGVIAMHTLRRSYLDYCKNLSHAPAENGTPLRSVLPPVQGYRATQWLGITAPLSLPILFVLVWLVLLLKAF